MPAEGIPGSPEGALAGAAALLDDDQAAAILAAALASRGGSVIECRATNLRYRTGRRLAVRYRTRVRWRDDAVTDETAVLLVDRDGPPDGAAVVSDSATDVAAWLYPADPFLPGLASAAAPAAVAHLLAELGAGDAPAVVRPRVYRPTARAVLAVHGAADAYLKVVRPGAAAELADLHRALARTLPVPWVHGVAERQGIVVLEARRGEELGAALVAGRAVPHPRELVELLDRVADAPTASTPETPQQQARSYRETLTATLPAEAARVAALADAVVGADWQPDRTVHGDFYEAQVLVDGGAVTTLLDVDRLRPGDAVDDLATLLAHLRVLADAHPGATARITAYHDAVWALAAGRAGGAALRLRVAGQLLGLATWPFRGRLPDWPDRTRVLLAAAERLVDEEDLMREQRSSHLAGAASRR